LEIYICRILIKNPTMTRLNPNTNPKLPEPEPEPEP
jgi:hypothetical protein